MKKAYIVTSGNYSDYRIVGVFSSKDKANELLRLYDKGNARIEDWSIDNPLPTIPNGYLPWQVEMNIEGDCQAYTVSPENFAVNETRCFMRTTYTLLGETRNELVMLTNCLAASREHAVKIANERRSAIIANNNFVDHFLQEGSILFEAT